MSDGREAEDKQINSMNKVLALRAYALLSVATMTYFLPARKIDLPGVSR